MMRGLVTYRLVHCFQIFEVHPLLRIKGFRIVKVFILPAMTGQTYGVVEQGSNIAVCAVIKSELSTDKLIQILLE